MSDIKKTFNGVVRRQRVAVGSKSEHTALVLETANKTFVLRVRGDSPFSECAPAAPYVDRDVRIQGIVHKHYLFVGNIQGLPKR